MAAIADQVTSLENDHADALAKIDSLIASLAAVASANTSLTAENAALNKYADEIKAMVESVAGSALKMLQAARAPIVAEVEKIAADVVAEVKPLVLDVAGFLGDAPALAPAAEPAIVQTDSGDEQPAQAATPVPPAAPMWINRVPEDIAAVAAKAEAAIADIPDAVERMLHHSSASSAPPVTQIRAPVDMTMIVEHDGDGLPLFLRRGTTFDVLARARLAT